jgi:MFS family permease
MQNEEDVSQHTMRNILTRDFVFGFLALFTFIAASYTLIPTLPIYLERLGSNVTEIGVLVGTFAGSSLVFRLFVGRALLRYSEKSIIMFGAILFAVTFLACIVFRPFWPFFVVRFLQGVAFACVDTAALAFIINVIPLAYRGQSIAYFLMAPNVALALAPSFGMLVINHYNFIVLFLVGTGLSLCALCLAGKLKGPQAVSPHKGAPAKSTLMLERKVVAPAITAFLHNCVWGALITFLPLYAVKCGIKNPGYFFSASAIMLIAGRSLGGRILDTYSKEKIIVTFIFTSMVAMVILSFSKTLSMLILVGLLFGIGSAFLYPASMAYAFEYAGSSGGTAVGTIRALMDLGIALGPVMMGIILPLTSYRTMFLCVALICFINLNYFQFYVRKKGNRKPSA